MKLFSHPNIRGRLASLRHERGSAVLIVIILLACIAILVIANTRTLHWLRRELALIEEKQLQRHGQSPRH